MTREEAIEGFRHSVSMSKLDLRFNKKNMSIEREIMVLNSIARNGMAIKALEQEPCEDVVSRQAVIDEIEFYQINPQHFDFVSLIDNIKDLPPVTSECKKGKWINKSQKSGCGITFVASECTCCGKKTLFNCDELIYRYCPNCGAEMESES